MKRFAVATHKRQEALILEIMQNNADKEGWSDEKIFNAKARITNITTERKAEFVGKLQKQETQDD